MTVQPPRLNGRGYVILENVLAAPLRSGVSREVFASHVVSARSGRGLDEFYHRFAFLFGLLFYLQRNCHAVVLANLGAL